MKEEKEPIKIKLSTAILSFIIFILIVIIIGIILYYNVYKVADNNENQTNNNITIKNEELNQNTPNIIKESKIKELDIDSDTVQKLYKNIVKDNECVEEISYQTKKVTSDNLNNIAKLKTIFDNIKDSEADSTETKKNSYGESETHYYFKKETIENKAKEIFGSNVKIINETLPNLLAKEIIYNNGIYDKYEIQGGGAFPWEDSTEYITKAEISDDEIYIYDKYVHLVREEKDLGESYDVYNASDKKVKIAENIESKNINSGIEGLTGSERSKKIIQNIENTTNKNVNTFKHTFKKDSNGNYYWYSTEPIK